MKPSIKQFVIFFIVKFRLYYKSKEFKGVTSMNKLAYLSARTYLITKTKNNQPFE